MDVFADHRFISPNQCAAHRGFHGALSFAIDFPPERREVKSGAPSVFSVDLPLENTALGEPAEHTGQGAWMHAKHLRDVAGGHLGRSTEHADHEALRAGHAERLRCTVGLGGCWSTRPRCGARSACSGGCRRRMARALEALRFSRARFESA
jgi:hypothetical protein